MREKVAIFMPSRAMGGAEQLSCVLARAFAAGEWDVTYAIPFSLATANLREDVEAAGVKVEDADFECAEGSRRPVRFALQVLKALRWLKQRRPNRVLVFLPWPTAALPIICSLGWAGIPSLLIFQLVPPQFLLGRRHRQLLQWAISKPSLGCLAVCQENRKLLVEKMGLPTEKVAVVYNGTPQIDAVTESVRITGQEWLQSQGLVGRNPLVVTSGRLCHQKGYDLVVSVLPHLRQEFPQLCCLWLGAPEADYAQHLESAMQQLKVEDLVVRPGAVRDVTPVLCHADLFLFPSRFEGHSLALTEAMAAGLPIVASDASGIPEVIRHGVEGLIFRNGDSCDLMEKVRWALRHPEEMRRMGAAARERQKKFTEEKMVEGTLKYLNKIVEGRTLA
jgi:glycosyltransferase involved in cell wall biosynthesis